MVLLGNGNKPPNLFRSTLDTGLVVLFSLPMAARFRWVSPAQHADVVKAGYRTSSFSTIEDTSSANRDR